MAWYRGIRLRFGYGFESCDANSTRNVQKHKPRETQTRVFSPFLVVGSKELVLKVPKRGQCHAAIRVTPKCCDSCAQGAPERRTVSRRNFCDAESLAKRYAKHATKPKKRTPKHTEEWNVFTEFFHRIFSPKFRCVFFCSQNSTCH